MATTTTPDAVPLFVDLDGTLLATDTLWESVLAVLRSQPSAVMLLPFWLWQGKACLKAELAKRAALNPATLPYRKEVLSFLARERSSGREIILATACDRRTAKAIADHLGIFSAVLASDGAHNLAGLNKLNALQGHAGSRSFDYMGNAKVDLPLWQASRRAILVNPSPHLLRHAQRISRVETIFPSPAKGPLIALQAMRPHQWTKNLLLFVPLLMAHKIDDVVRLAQAAQAFAAFCLCASGVYLINDLLDIDADRQHPDKQHRPFAAGRLQITTGIVLAIFLVTISFLLALPLPQMFLLFLALYFILSTAYSLHLKKRLIVDVIVLAGLYTLRILAGGVAVEVHVTPWLLAFSMFTFLSLAFVKRYSDLLIIHQAHPTITDKERGYEFTDLDMIRSLGSSSGYLSVLVLALYINSRDVTILYHQPAVLWLIGPLWIYWITRIWFLANRGKIGSDPILFTIRDWVSYIVGLLIALTIMLATLPWA